MLKYRTMLGNISTSYICRATLPIIERGDIKGLTRVMGVLEMDNQLTSCARHKKSGDTVHNIAARHGHLSILKYLHSLDGWTDAIECENVDGKRPLHEAVQCGSLECVKYLLSAGANVNSLKRADWTPLMLACTRNNLDIVVELVQNGSELLLHNKDGWTALHIAAREGDAKILNYLLDCDTKAWDTRSHNHRTPLHSAALHGRLDAIRILLSRGGYETDMIDSCQSTPLMDALRAGHLRVADLFINQHNANVNAEDVMGRQCLHLAAETGSTDSIHYLVTEHNVDVNTMNSLTASTPLHYAVKEAHFDAIRLLLSLGADIHRKDNRGRTALQIASKNNYDACAKILHAAHSKFDIVK